MKAKNVRDFFESLGERGRNALKEETEPPRGLRKEHNVAKKTRDGVGQMMRLMRKLSWREGCRRVVHEKESGGEDHVGSLDKI